jgi:hypothetical protein
MEKEYQISFEEIFDSLYRAVREKQMSYWKNRLDIKTEWVKAKNGEMTPEELGKIIAKKIRQLKCYQDEVDTLEELVYGFENITDGVREFDDLMEQLYDWGDIKLNDRFPPDKMCWIATNF